MSLAPPSRARNFPYIFPQPISFALASTVGQCFDQLMTLEKMLLVLSLFFAMPCFAGTSTVGDGGHGVLCSNGQRDSVQLLDYYLAPPVRPAWLKLNQEEAIQVSARKLAQRLHMNQTSEAVLRNDIRGLIADFSSPDRQFEHLDQRVVVKAPDLDEQTRTRMTQENCRVVLLAAAVRAPGEIRYYFNSDHARLVDGSAVYGLAIHETIRRIQSQFGLNEVQIRRLTTDVSSYDEPL